MEPIFEFENGKIFQEDCLDFLKSIPSGTADTVFADPPYNIKKAKYDPILDCSKIDVDLKIAFRKKGYFGMDEEYEFSALEDGAEVKNTIELLNEIYHGNTAQKKLEAVHIRRKLRRSLSDFENLVREYEEAEEIDKEDFKYAIRKETSAGAAFAAFKRWLLRDNRERYEDLLRFCGL